MAGNPAGLSDVVVAAMIGYARGDQRVINALSLRFVHGQSLRQIARGLQVQHTTVRDWVQGYASTMKDYCRIRGRGVEALQAGSEKDCA